MAQRTARGRKGGDVCVIFVHAGAGYHSVQNEGLHLQACNDAAKAGMAMLRNGGTAVDAVEIAIKILEDREITNAGYGSNLAMDGVVECDAIVVDHYGRSGGVGAVAQIKNPISLARLILDHTTKPLLLKRVPPNLLVAQGATDFAFEQGMSILPHDALVSPAARDRWLKWRADLRCAERRARRALPSPISQASYTSEELCPFHEEQVRKKMRENHTKAMLRGFVDVDESMVAPKPTPQQPTSSPVSNNMSDASATSQLASNSSMASLLDADRLDSSRPASFAEATHNPLINSTQTVPTLSSLHSAQDLDRSQTPDVEMSDIDDDIDFAVYHAGDRRLQRSQAWHDGGLEDESDSSSDTLRLPSLTPSPAPLEAVQKPLPETPQDDLSNLARTTTNLHHVVEKAPLPPEPSQVRLQEPSQQQRQEKREDHITDTVGVVAVDCYGHIACGASSGGIGMKYRGRIGPAALVGVGAAVMPMDPDDRDKVSVATVTSGTGEHMATTMAAMVGSERLYHSMKRDKDGNVTAVNEEEAIRSMIDKDFMGHSSVKNSNSAGAIGVLSVKKTRDGVYLYFAHNTDSFALASMHSDEDRPTCTMSRSTGNSSIAQGGRAIRYRRKQR